ncbi:alpha/beta hydrolase [Streptomyces pactum]|uniref:alpha/beta hydrolase n=1 Tax=Streptomyces pactum TaxID=68249 RepID=UPI00370175F4
MSRSIRTKRARTLVAAVLVMALGGLSACSDGGDGKSPDASAPGSGSSASDAPGPDGSGLPASLTGQKLAWEACGAPTAAQGAFGGAPGDGWECATMKAPLNYAEPTGETIDLALIRAKSTGKGKRIGSLLFNFGGPGGSGVASLPAFEEDYSTLRGRYDLVSFDPRGVGESAGVRCLEGEDLDAYHTVDNSPDDDAELEAVRAANKTYVEACRKNSGTMLPYVDTVSAARDMDLMRQVLGDEKLHYFGISYGTELGGVYAHLFPKKVGRSVLDAVVDPLEDPLFEGLAQAKGFQLALNNYMADCAADTECPTGRGGAEGSRKIAALLKQLDQQPLAVGDRKLTQDLAVTGIAAALYDQETWEYLTIALDEAMNQGSGETLLLLADSYLGRDPAGRYSNLHAANRAINCVDDNERYTVEDVKTWLPKFRKASPVFGEFMAWGTLGCTDWPVEGDKAPLEVSAEGAAPIVVIGNTGDPATPYEGARAMALKLGDDVGVMVTLKGEGHGGYNSGNSCLKKAVDAYLLDGKVPAQNTTCS